MIGFEPKAVVPTKSLDRRGLILRAASDSFAELGYQNTSLNAICDGAGIAKPTLYHYFPSKAALLNQLLGEYLEMLITASEDPERRQLPPSDRLFLLMKDMLTSLDTHRGQVRCFYENATEFLPSSMRARISERRQYYNEQIEYVLLVGRDSGDFVIPDVRMIRLSIFALCGWPYNWYRPGGSVTTEKITEHVWNLVMSGIKA
ncbi:TetR/AcrR family transcriptional regulator [Rhodococcus oxybenzonivorans]|uniref:TetR/AcrR family transcriptional regulator n=1 Tax=Rhodococcus oxybenzonivorans TaxID=1990687 RepID=UPI0013A5BC64|nr:TetR/AcrR family transcriptional regulator [Rhodococcus oxybenzonivorans]